MSKSKKKKKQIIISALLSSLFLTIAAVLLIYSYVRTWSPFVKVYANTNNKAQTITVNVNSRVPVKTFVEYGTSQMYLNQTEVSNEYKVTHQIPVKGYLPERKHFVRVVAKTEMGKEYKSDFIVIS